MSKRQLFIVAGVNQFARLVTALTLVGLIAVVALVPTNGPALAAPSPGINNQINFQGRLLNAAGAVIADGNYNMEFKIYKNGDGLAATDNTCTITDCASTTGTLLWTEDWMNVASHGVTVKNGYFSVSLGSITTLVGVDFNQPVMWLSMNVASGANQTSSCAAPFAANCTPDGEMLPMRRMSSSAYALNAGQLGGIAATGFIQNVSPASTQQTANINVLSGAATTVAAAKIQTVASATAPVLLLEGGATPGAGGDLLQLQDSTTAVVAAFTSAGDLQFGKSANHTISVIAQTASNTAGSNLTISAATGNGTGDGGTLALASGTSGTGVTGNGGSLMVTGGNAASTNGNGGNITISAGAKTGSGTPGSVIVKPQASNDSVGAFQIQNAAGTSILTVDTTTTGRALRVGTGSTSTTAPPLLVENTNATGDTGIEFKNSAIGSNFFVGQDSSNGGAFSINSGSASSSSPSTISFVQAPAPTSATPTATSTSLAFGSNNTAGNTIIAVAAWDAAGGSAATCSDTRGNSYTNAVVKLESTNNDYLLVCVASNIAAGANTVTVTYGITHTSRILSIHEYSGVRAVSPVDVTASNIGTTTTATDSLTSGTATPTQNGDLIFGAFYDTVSTSQTLSAGTGYTQRTNNTANSYWVITEDKVQSTAATTATTVSASAGAHSYVGALVALKATTSQGDNFTNSLFTLGQGGQATFRNFTDSTSAFQIQNAAGTGILSANTTSSLITVRGTNSDAVLTAATIDTGNQLGGGVTQDFPGSWSGTGWTRNANAAIHTSGTTALTSTFTPTAGVTYKVTYTYSLCTSVNTLAIAMGGVVLENAANCVNTNAKVITALSAAPLTFTPSGTYVGTVSNVTVSVLTASNPVLAVNNSSNVTTLEVRSPSDTSNLFIGLQSGQSNTSTAIYNTGVGTRALQNNTDGTDNTAMGYIALAQNATGTDNAAFGSVALYNNTVGSQNTGIGSQALGNNTRGQLNTAVGYWALLDNVNGSNNTAIGGQSLSNVTTGTANTAIGAQALSLLSSGGSNTALGYSALGNVFIGSNNTGIGYQAGGQDPTVTTFQTLATISNATAIGYGSQVQANNSLVLGGQGANAVKVGIGTTIPSNTLSVSPVQYSAGTAGTSGATTATVTGVGTAWSQSMVGSEFIFADGAKGTITAVATSGLSLTLSNTVTEAGTANAYRIHYTGLQVTSGGQIGIGTASPTSVLTVTGLQPATAAAGAGSAATSILSVQGSTGGNASATTGVTAGAGAALSLTSGTGGAASGASGANVGGAGGVITIQGSNGGAATSGTGGAGANIVLTAGNGGSGTTAGGDAGDILLTSGAVGSGGAPAPGSIIAKSGTNGTAAFQIQNAAGTSLFNIDTTNQMITATALTQGAVANVGSAKRSYSDDFETGTTELWTTTTASAGTIAADTTFSHSGKYAAKMTTTGGTDLADLATKSPNNISGTTVYSREYVYITSTSSSFLNLMEHVDTVAAKEVDVYRDNSTGFIGAWNGFSGAGVFNNSSTVLTLNAWHKIEVRTVKGAPGTITVWLDNVQVVSVTAQTVVTNTIDKIQVGDSSPGSQGVAYFDDVAVDSVATGDVADMYSQDTIHAVGNISSGGLLVAQTGLISDGITKVQTNSTAAFQVQNAAGNQLLTVDSSGNNILIGKPGASGITGILQFANSAGGNLVSLQAGASSAAYALTLPTVAPTTSQCLQSGATTATLLVFSSCAGGGGANTALSNLASVAINTDLQFANGAARTISIAASGAGTAGSNITLQPGAGGTTGTGGVTTISGGNGGTSGSGGTLQLFGGLAGASGGNGGNVVISAGGISAGNAGSVIIKPIASSDSTTAFLIQNAAGTTNLMTVDTTNSAIKLNPGAITTTNNQAGVIIGSGYSSSDTTLSALTLDSTTTFAETANTCTASANGGALYYNSVTNSVRACQDGSWNDVVTTKDLGLVMFGVVPESGPTPGDLAGVNATDASDGPCKVYMGSVANSVRWTGCVVYAFGRRQVIAAQATDFTTSLTTTASNFQNLCIFTAGSAPSFGTANATESTASLPSPWSESAPTFCLATIKEIAAGSGIGAIYDTRVFTDTVKVPVTIATASALAYALKPNATSVGQFAPTSATTSAFAGVLVSYSGSTATTTINGIMAVHGPVYVKGSAGTAGTYVRPTAAGGIVNTSALVTAVQTDIPYNYLGLAESTFNAPVGTQCSTTANADTCRGSILVNINIR